MLKNRAWWKAVMTDQELDLYEFETMLATKDLDHKGDAIGIDAVIVPLPNALEAQVTRTKPHVVARGRGIEAHLAALMGEAHVGKAGSELLAESDCVDE